MLLGESLIVIVTLLFLVAGFLYFERCAKSYIDFGRKVRKVEPDIFSRMARTSNSFLLPNSKAWILWRVGGYLIDSHDAEVQLTNGTLIAEAKILRKKLRRFRWRLIIFSWVSFVVLIYLGFFS